MIDIRLEGVSKHYGSGGATVRAVDDVTLSVASGELFFLLGPSGCGKTTLLRMIAGLIAPAAGRIYFGDRDVTDLPPERRNAPMVFQNYALFPHMSVAGNVEFGPKMRRLPRAHRREAVGRTLHRVRMGQFARRRPNQLSGGQQQRVALARALAADGDCLLLDEPLSNLDARLRMHMRGELRTLVKSTGITAMYVTHDQKEALSMADRVAVMNAGRIVQIGRPQEIYNRPATRFVADFLGEANFIDGQVLAPGKPVRIETPAGELLGESWDAEDGHVTCCVRPERIEIVPPEQAVPAPGRCVLTATVVSQIYLGETGQYLCRLRNGALWKVSLLSSARKPLTDGSDVALVINPADVICLPTTNTK